MRKERGFTLIEIIAVLVILGILAAVAIPKYQDLQVAAARRAAEGGVAAGMSACSLYYSRALLDTAVTFGCAAALGEVQTSGDITVALQTDSGNICEILGTAKGGETASGIWTAP